MLVVPVLLAHLGAAGAEILAHLVVGNHLLTLVEANLLAGQAAESYPAVVLINEAPLAFWSWVVSLLAEWLKGVLSLVCHLHPFQGRFPSPWGPSSPGKADADLALAVASLVVEGTQMEVLVESLDADQVASWEKSCWEACQGVCWAVHQC